MSEHWRVYKPCSINCVALRFCLSARRLSSTKPRRITAKLRSNVTSCAAKTTSPLVTACRWYCRSAHSAVLKPTRSIYTAPCARSIRRRICTSCIWATRTWSAHHRKFWSKWMRNAPPPFARSPVRANAVRTPPRMRVWLPIYSPTRKNAPST